MHASHRWQFWKSLTKLGTLHRSRQDSVKSGTPIMPSVDHIRAQESTQDRDSGDVSPVERLVHWFKTNGGELSPDVDIAFSESSGYHCRAKRRLGSAVVAKCPLSLTLSYLNLDHAQSIVPHVESPLVECVGQVPNHVLTYLLLVEQRRHPNQDRMKWYPYIACLPEPGSMTTPLWFDNEDLKCLTGTNLARETSVKLDQLTKEWNQANNVLERVGVNAETYSFEWFRWAATIISSRAFISTHVIPGKDTFPILFPVVDILNHSPIAKVEWDFHPLQDFAIRILNHDSIRPGDELYNNYAPKQNDELLLGYGFCVSDNPVEQFAIKMRLDPRIEQAARSLNMFEPNNIPFEMDTSFLSSDSKEEPEYLRPKGHPFGRYVNRVPFFRGIPPSVMHMFYIRALMNLNVNPASVKVDSIPPRIVFETLLLAHEAIQKRSESLPLSPEQRHTFPNVKLKYATIYREGQAKIIHGIRAELKAVIAALRFYDGVPQHPVIVSTTEALARLSAEFPSHYSHFKSGLEQQYGVDLTSCTQYSADISSLEAGEQPAELSVWKMLLCLCLVLYQKNESGTTQAHNGPQQVVYGWMEYLISEHPPPTRTADMDAEMLQDFILGWKENEEMVERAYTWADEVVNRLAFPLDEEVAGEDVQRICMYLEIGVGDDAAGEWMYRDAEKV
ncbi:SET domain-containing protein [Bimuria novae-zelandiae CBS 107.79]|uniref:SET domain-containing protein n=1 Tax=Bimuria novae-zelandiae CBS 107.79 TaxID=1447943 RepID=A0A6A5VLE4_9PLEO|nr:SET domain-containing protein [Bimuria novae-zelandiae CBS 107.79]